MKHPVQQNHKHKNLYTPGVVRSHVGPMTRASGSDIGSVGDETSESYPNSYNAIQHSHYNDLGKFDLLQIRGKSVKKSPGKPLRAL